MTRGLSGPIPISQEAQDSPDDYRSEWVDWYIRAAAQFIKLHIDTEDAGSSAAA
jgi:hypothetical protein